MCLCAPPVTRVPRVTAEKILNTIINHKTVIIQKLPRFFCNSCTLPPLSPLLPLLTLAKFLFSSEMAESSQTTPIIGHYWLICPIADETKLDDAICKSMNLVISNNIRRHQEHEFADREHYVLMGILRGSATPPTFRLY